MTIYDEADRDVSNAIELAKSMGFTDEFKKAGRVAQEKAEESDDSNWEEEDNLNQY